MNLVEAFSSPFGITVLLSGLCLLLAGLLLYWKPPKQINGLIGYRTKNSMLNQERWDYSQKYAGKLMAAMGFIITVIGFFGHVIPDSIGVLMALGIIIIAVVVLIVNTERAIERKFE